MGYAEDSFTVSEFDITPYVKETGNRLCVEVHKRSTAAFLEDQDFFRFFGLFRDVNLYGLPDIHVSDLWIRPKCALDGRQASMEIELKTTKGKTASYADARAEICLLDGHQMIAKEEVSVSESFRADLTISEPVQLWNCDDPKLYQVEIRIFDGQGDLIEIIPYQVGFRMICIEDGKIKLNGRRLIINGVNRHEWNAKSGRCISENDEIYDIECMKRNNINAVRTCHYPDRTTWYYRCDEAGIYVMAEVNLESHGSWQKMGSVEPSWNVPGSVELWQDVVLDRVKSNFEMFKNHTSVLFWSLGNESYAGEVLKEMNAYYKKRDPGRLVHYEGVFQNRDYEDNISDVESQMYAPPGRVREYLENEPKKPFILCEYMHDMGNSLGGMKSYIDLLDQYEKYQGGFIWDFVDQSVRWTGKNGKMIYAYGGDFNRFDASDVNFCNNGLVSPDRVPNPHMYEVGRIYQNIWTTPADLQRGEINVFNENFFRDLSGCYLEWEMLKDGKVMRSGRVDDLNVAPQQTAKVKLDLGTVCQCAEWLLNVSYKLKEREGLLPAGHIVAKDQLTLNAYQAPAMDLKNTELSNVEVAAPVIQENDCNYLIVSGEAFRMEFNKHTGYLTKYEVNGLDMIKEGEALTPNFWRAPTDNDFGANLQRKYAVWKNPEIKLTSFSQHTENGQVIVDAAYKLPEASAELGLTYVINNSGAVKITQKMVADKNAKVANLFRFGMQMPMPRSFETVEYYGRGPVENYADRNHCTDLGIYRQSVSEQFYPYIRPQENGTKTDIRWWKMLDAAGNGIEAVAAAPFSASALHYTIESLDEGWSKRQGHSQEVEEADLTNFCIDKVQAGLGCEDSWGRIARPEYQVPYADYEFTFILTPVRHNIGIQ